MLCEDMALLPEKSKLPDCIGAAVKNEPYSARAAVTVLSVKEILRPRDCDCARRGRLRRGGQWSVASGQVLNQDWNHRIGRLAGGERLRWSRFARLLIPRPFARWGSRLPGLWERSLQDRGRRGGRCCGSEERGRSPLAMGLGDRDWGLVSEGSRDGHTEIHHAEPSLRVSPLAMGGCLGDRVQVLNEDWNHRTGHVAGDGWLRWSPYCRLFAQNLNVDRSDFSGGSGRFVLGEARRRDPDECGHKWKTMDGKELVRIHESWNLSSAGM